MNPVVGWALVAAALVAGWFAYGYHGLALAGSAIAFWLLLQFSRALRVMRGLADAPVGHVPSAVMFNAKLKAGMQMLAVMKLTNSLGRRLDPANEEVLAWADEGGSEVVITFKLGRCASWVLRRPTEAAEAAE